MQLRAYQQAALNATYRFIEKESGHGIMNAACGAGKSILLARTAEELYRRNKRPVVLADRAKLILQNSEKYSDYNNIGIVSSGLGKAEYNKSVIMAGIQTIYDKANLLGHVDYFLVDECQAIGNDFTSDTRYHKFFREYPNARILGYTATPFTLREGQLSWGKIYHEIEYTDLVKQGYLSPLTNKILADPDLSNVKKSGKEYNINSLSDFMSKDRLVMETAFNAADKIAIAKRSRGLTYCVDRKHAEKMCFALFKAGIRADLIDGTMSETQREQKYIAFAQGEIDNLVNIEVLTTGVDFPFIDYIICTRPTESLGLWHQMLGRGTRLYEGKRDCLILDYSGNLMKFGGLSNPIWKYMGSKKVKVGKAQKICPSCEESIAVGSEQCPACGYEFEKTDILREIEHETIADLNSDIDRRDDEKFVIVKNIFYSYHESARGNKFLRVDYIWGNANNTVSEFMPFEDKTAWARKKCLTFIKPRSTMLPETIDEALKLADTWKKPKVLKIKRQKDNPKYWEVIEVNEWVVNETH